MRNMRSASFLLSAALEHSKFHHGAGGGLLCVCGLNALNVLWGFIDEFLDVVAVSAKIEHK